MKKTWTVLCLILLLLPLPGALLKLPGLTGESRDAAFEQAMGFRAEMLAAHRAVSRWIGMSGSDQVALGKGGALYLAETLPEAAGAETLADARVEEIAQALFTLDRQLRAKGAYLIFLCAPSKANLMPDSLPYYAPHRTGESALDRLQARLAALGVMSVDVKTLLRGMDGAYLRTDTHWSDAGARAVYRALMEALPAAAWDGCDGAEEEEAQILGDLTDLIDPAYGEKETVMRAVLPRRYRTAGAMRTVMDMNIETRSEANGLRVVMLRDSFANALFPYLANNVGELKMIRASRWQDGFWREGADAVILEIAERDLDRLIP